MKAMEVKNFTKGWLVGDFEPSLLRHKDVEVAVKFYKKGDLEPRHHHKIATEITVVLEGRARAFDRIWEKGEIMVVEPGDSTSFEALTDVSTLVIKSPSIPADKYIDE